MTGVEGYVESAASGFLAGVETARRLLGQAPIDFPRETAIGALGLYVSDTTVANFQPMNVNFGIMPPLGCRIKGKRNKNAEQFAVNADDVTMNSSFEDDLSADSVDLVELVMAMEEEFEIDEIPEEDLLTLKTVGDCVRYLTAKLN